MQITNSTGVDLYVAALGDVVADGATVDIDEQLAEQLAAQGWTTKPAKRPANSKADEAITEEN